MEKKKVIRATRVERVLRPEGAYVYGSDFLLGLIKSARLLLVAASGEKRPKDGDNFLTFHGPSAIVMSVTALDVFLNEMLNTCLRTLTINQDAFETLAKKDSLVDKFAKIPRLVTGGPELVNPDIALVQLVRNEIVHFYPPIGATGVPEWLRPLADKGLLFSVGARPNDIAWPSKVQSFQLARWCAGTVVSAVNQFVEALHEGHPGKAKTMVAFEAQSVPAHFSQLKI